MYRPKNPFTTPFMILNPMYKEELGKLIPIYPEEGVIILASFKTFGGTEIVANGVLAVQDTGEVETWYTPDIKKDTHLKCMDDGKVYEVIGTPENIEMRNQFLKLKVNSLRGSHG